MEVLEEIAVADLVESWRRDLGIDVGPAFEGVATLRLCRDRATGRIVFAPAVAGKFKIEPGQKYVSRYRYLVTSEAANSKLINEHWRQYAKGGE